MGMIAYLYRVTEHQLEVFKSNSSLLEEVFCLEELDDNILDLDKSWDGITFLLTGHGSTEKWGKEIFYNIFMSENVVDIDQDFGYGPAHYIKYDELKVLYEELNRISNQELENRFNPIQMTSLDVYPNTWEQPESKEFILESIDSLKSFYANAIAENQYVISAIL